MRKEDNANRNREAQGGERQTGAHQVGSGKEGTRGAESRKAGARQEQGVIAGRNAVLEAISAGRPIDAIYLRRSEARNGSVRLVMAKAKDKGIAIKEVDGKKLDFLCRGENHQGVAAIAAVKEYASLDEVFALARAREEAPFLIVCDELSDPHNLGAILRTAECAGAHGVIVPKRRSAGLTYAVGKASAGALEYVPVVRVSNIAETLKTLKKQGVWIYAADMHGQQWCSLEYRGAVALVIGSEGTGIGRLVKEQADFVVSLPLHGQIRSLNASVAAGVLCFEIARQRAGLKAMNP